MKPDRCTLAAAIEAIQDGRPIVVPTDTVYGLAVRAGDQHGLDLIFAMKRRPIERSIAILVADIDQVSDFARMGPLERLAAAAFWPGALTLVVQKLPDTDPSFGRSDGTVGVRCPAHQFVRDLAREVGPLATTSANLSGEPTPDDATEAATMLDGEVAVIVDDGPSRGRASTVARIHDDGTVTVFREGDVSVDMLTEAIEGRYHRRG